MIAPVVLGIELCALVPGVPFFFREFVRNMAFVIENIWIFTK